MRNYEIGGSQQVSAPDGWDSPRQNDLLFTDEKGHFISESSTYCIREGFDLVDSPVFTVLNAADECKKATQRVNKLRQTDFIYSKSLGWARYYHSTGLDVFSR